MKYSIKIFSLFGIPVELHVSFLLLILIIYILAFLKFITVQSAILITLVFVTVIIHEFSHSYVAQKYGVTIERIILLPIGGVSEMTEIPKNPAQELRIAIAGPFTNFVIALFCYLIIILLGTLVSRNVYLFLYTFLIVNLILGAFNLLPAYPMDGGRVLRAFLAERMNYIRATEIAATVGKQLAIVMAIAGIFIPGYFLLILIALFVYIGAEQEYKAVLISTLLEGLYVKDIMTKEVKSVKPDMTIDDAMKMMFLYKHMGYPVTEGRRLLGILTFHDISKIPEDERNIPIREIMTKKVITSDPKEELVETLEKLNKNEIGRLPVVKDDELVGIVSKTDIMRALEILNVRSRK
jgi:Zn-dependent protease/predicted transcriptional regulator